MQKNKVIHETSQSVPLEVCFFPLILHLLLSYDIAYGIDITPCTMRYSMNVVCIVLTGYDRSNAQSVAHKIIFHLKLNYMWVGLYLKLS